MIAQAPLGQFVPQWLNDSQRSRTKRHYWPAGVQLIAKPLASHVPYMFFLAMPSISPESVSAAIRSAPAFAKLGLSMRDPRCRERAIEALSLAIVENLTESPLLPDVNQMLLPL